MWAATLALFLPVIAGVRHTSSSIQSTHSAEGSSAGYPTLKAHADQSCDEEVGVARMARYAQVGNGAGQPLCEGHGPSEFSCEANWEEWSATTARASDYACRGSNLRLTAEEGKRISLHAPECSWKLGDPEGLNLQFFIFGGKPVPLELSSEARACDETLGSGSTLLLYSEADFWNPFISQAQAVMAYATLHAMSIDPKKVRVLLTSKASSDQAMFKLISGAFSQGGEILQPGPQARTVCAQDVVVPAGGANSWIRRDPGSANAWAKKCNNAPLLRGYASFLMSAFNVAPTPPASTGHRVTLLVREPSSVHPEDFRRHLSNKDEVSQTLTASGLQLSKEDQERRLSLTAFSNSLAQALRGEGAIVSLAQPELMSIAEQVKLFADTDILISAHSAALSNLFLLPKCGQILEFCTGGDFQFVNYAQLAGREHRCMPGLTAGWGTTDFTADVDTVLQMEKDAAVRLRECEAATSAAA